MKILKLKVLVVLVAMFSLISGCKDDTTEVVSQFVGNYTITSASLAETLTLVTTNPNGSLPIPVGMDLTQAIQNSLLSSASCTSADKAWVELRKDKSMYMSCEGSNAFNAGTWEEVDATTLKLNMNNKAIPTSPTGYVLTVSNVVKTATGLTGKTSVPLPKEMFAATLAGFGMTIADTPAIYMVTFSLGFTKR
jgi:hypothetical protein